MKKFNIKVNGKSYKVEVEEIRDESPSPAIRPQAAAPMPKPVLAAQPKADKVAAAVDTGGTKVNSPMPGMIVAIEVKKGDPVKQGQVLLILEAMKMENEIPSPADGKIASINVTEGASVSTGDVLITLE